MEISINTHCASLKKNDFSKIANCLRKFGSYLRKFVEDRWSSDFAIFKKISWVVASTTLRQFRDEDTVKVDHHPQKYVNYTSNQKHIIKELVIFSLDVVFCYHG